MKRVFFIALFVIFTLPQAAVAQNTEFNYQGSLRSGGNPASGSHDFQFLLFDAAVGGSQVGTTLNINGVNIANGVFSVPLDFGNQFSGGERFLEVRVRVTGGGSFTPLTPRQRIASTPYAVKSLSADTATNAATAANFSGSLAGDVTGTQSATTIAPNAVDAANIASGQVVKGINNLKDNVTLAAGSNITITPSGNTLTIASTGGGGGGGILNQTTLQTGANFNIDGTGTANIFSATQYVIAGVGRILSAPSTNTFVGLFAGNDNNGGIGNVFVGYNAGESNTSGFDNVFVGSGSGERTTTGIGNAMLGGGAGLSNTSGTDNTFLGSSAGRFSEGGDENVFVGKSPGEGNVNGDNNLVQPAQLGGNADPKLWPNRRSARAKRFC
jgi:hypothetical protein